MADNGFPLQQAVYQRLTAELSVPVYDAVPADTPTPTSRLTGRWLAIPARSQAASGSCVCCT